MSSPDLNSKTERQPNEILKKESLAPSITLFEVYAPGIARSVRPGQFVVVRADDYAERIPLTVVDRQPDRQSITLVVQVVGVSTRKMDRLKVGEAFLDVAGPLGKPTAIKKHGTVVCIGGGVGVAPVYPITKAYKEAGNRIISIIGARTKEMIILEKEMRSVSDELYLTTDDGTEGRHGFVTDELLRLIDEKVKIDFVVAIGPGVMMKAVCGLTKKHGIPTIVSLNSLMVDGTGMCGGCRITVGNETKFVCVDGPEFDGHQVDFQELLKRSEMYRREEHRAMWDHECRLMEAEQKLKKANKREPMPKQDPKLRVQNFNEVALGYTKERALREASRCLSCKKSPCIAGCPVDIDIPGFIELVKQGDFIGAIRKIKEKNSLPPSAAASALRKSSARRLVFCLKKGSPSPSVDWRDSWPIMNSSRGTCACPRSPARRGRKSPSSEPARRA